MKMLTLDNFTESNILNFLKTMHNNHIDMKLEFI